MMNANATLEITVGAWTALQGKAMALELLALSILQRMSDGEKAVAAAMLMLDRYEKEHLGSQGPHRTPEIDAHFTVMRATLEKLAKEVLAFRAGEGVEMLG
jgi:hypothetical protein